MNNNVKYEKIYYILIILTLAYMNIFYHIWEIRFGTNDDIRMFLGGYDFWTTDAKIQGRIEYYIGGLFAQIPLLFKNFLYYNIVRISIVLVMILTFGWFINTLFRNRYMGYIYMIIMSTLWQNSVTSFDHTEGHNLIYTYPFYIIFPIITFLITVIFFVKYIRYDNFKYMIVSLVFWILTLKGSEFWVMYLPILPMLVYIELPKNRFNISFFKAILYSKWHIILTIINIIIYLLFRSYNASHYNGNSINLSSIERILSSWMEYTFALLPGLKFYYTYEKVGIQYILNLINFEIIFVSISVFILLQILRKKIIDIHITSINYIYIVVIAIYALLAPNFLISLTYKYQDWSSSTPISDYLYSSFSYFVIAFFIFILLFAFKRLKIIYIIISIIISLLVLTTGINNRFVGMQYESMGKKFTMIDAFLNSKDITNSSEILNISAPSLWSGLVAYSDFWSKYAKHKNDKEINFIKGYKSNRTIEYISSKLDKSSPFMIYSENNIVQSIFVLSQKCNNITPCYLLYSGDALNFKNHLYVEIYIYNKATPIMIDKIDDSNSKYSEVLIYKPTNSINSDQIIALIDYNPLSFFKPTIYSIEFLSGLYNWEGGFGNFVWSSGDVKVRLINRNIKTTKYRLQLNLGTLQDRNVIFNINGKEIKKVHLKANTKSHKVDIYFELPIGDNILDITTDKPAIKPDTADNRLLSFSMANIIYKMVEQK